MINHLKWILGLALAFGLAIVIGCQSAQEGEFFYGALGLEQKIIITSSGTVTASPFQLVQYSLEGVFEKVLYDSTFENRILRGIAVLDPFELAILTETNEAIQKYNLFDGISNFITNGNLTGNLYDLKQNPFTGDLFVTESANIESFDSRGNRIGNPRIAATVGSCAITTQARGLAINSSGYLIAGSQGNDDINMYNISNSGSTTCVATNQTLGNVDPIAIVAHSDGYIYVAHTNGTDSVLRFNGDLSGSSTTIWTGTTTTNPTAMIEMPDGSLLLANDGNNNIIRIDTSGNTISDPFIQDGFTTFVQDIAITEVY